MFRSSDIYYTIHGIIAGLAQKRLDLSNNTDVDDQDDYMMPEEHAQFAVDFMRQNPQVVEELKLEVNEKYSRTLSTQAVEIFRAHFTETTTTLSSIHVCGDLQAASTVRRLLSGLGGNPSVKKLTLENITLSDELENTGEIVSDVLQNMPHLKALFCKNLYLLNDIRVHGSCGKKSQLQKLVLKNCWLRDEGLSAIVDALEENDSIQLLDLSENDDLTSDGGLPHVTRFLQQHESSIKHIYLQGDSKILENEENAKLFFSACTKLQSLNLNKCSTPGQNVFPSFCDAFTNSTTLTSLFVYGRKYERVRGADLDRLLEIIPKLKLLHFSIDLDFTNESVLTSFRRNSSICRLYVWVYSWLRKEITDGPIMDILERNRESIRRQRKANELLEYEGRQTTETPTATTPSSSSLPLGVWGWTIGRLARDDKGAAATYDILCKKLPLWWVSSRSQESTTTTIAAPAAAPPTLSVTDVAIVGGPTTAASAATATAAATATKTETEWQEEMKSRDKLIASLQKELQESKMREDKCREERDRLQQQNIVRLDQTASLVAPRQEATISTSVNVGVYMQEDMPASEESTANNASNRKRGE